MAGTGTRQSVSSLETLSPEETARRLISGDSTQEEGFERLNWQFKRLSSRSDVGTGSSNVRPRVRTSELAVQTFVLEFGRRNWQFKRSSSSSDVGTASSNVRPRVPTSDPPVPTFVL